MGKNPSIKCTVDECKYHAQTENYCSLNVQVEKHEIVQLLRIPDCNSFELK